MSKKLLLVLCLFIVAFTRCSTNKSRQLIETNLPSQYFTIDINKDTVIHTAKGALITIPKGSLKCDGAASVKIEVKEAYTIADMVLAGLTTKAGNDLLSSGGMICINAADKNVTITQPIAVSIPAKNQQDGMQLYKGEKTHGGTIDWTDPQPLAKQALSAPLARGKALYTTNCASCHNTGKDAIGPPLAFLDKRRDWKWLTGFVHNSSKMIAQGDKLANCIYTRYGKAAMTHFPMLSDEEIHEIFDYAGYQARNTDPAAIPDFKKAFDSCLLYDKLRTALTEKRNRLIEANDPQVAINRAAIQIPALTPGNAMPENRVHAAANAAEYYQFNIQAFGWYNVDILLKNLPGFENSTLTVRITGEYKYEVNVYLVIPSCKGFIPGGLAADKTDEYAFFTDDGKIPLPQNSKAYIIAMGEYNRQLYFGKTDFITSLQQTPSIQLTAMTKEQMNIEITKLNIEDLDIKAADTKNAGEIRQIDARLDELERFKPKGCDCNCLQETDTASSEIIEKNSSLR